MEKFIYTLLMLCLVFADSSVDSGKEKNVTTLKLDYLHGIKPTPRKSTWIDFTPAVQLDLFELTGHAVSRRSESEIWNWDIWCQLQSLPGNCTKQMVRYYYDSDLDQCQTFSYSGCGGNKNNFDSTLTCERHCKGAAYMKIGGKLGSACELQPSSGLCMAFIEKYYFDTKTRTCIIFTYGGCGGNQNRFNSLEDCESECKTLIRKEETEDDAE